MWPGFERARRFPDAAGARASASPGVWIGVEHEGRAVVEHRRAARRRCRRAASAPADRPGCRSAGRDRFSTARIAADQLAHAVVRGVAHVDAEHVGAGLEQPRDHRRHSGGRTEGGDDLGAAQPSHLAGLRGSCDGACRPGVGSIGVPGVSGRCCGAFRGVGELHRPGALLAGVDLEEAGAVEAARQAILDAADGELLVARAHEGLARPFAAAVVVDRVDVIEARDQGALEQRLAAARRQVPPAFGGPAAVGVLVADRDADAAAGVVAQTEVGQRRRRRQRERRRDQQKSAGIKRA